MSLTAVDNDPLLSEPDVFQATEGGEVSLSPESPSGLHLRGGASDQTAYLLDGIPTLSPYHTAGTFSAWNPDALSRLDLLTTAPSADAPDALSGVVSARTRSPGPHQRMQGSMSTTQSRVTLDGPLGNGGLGYLVSYRSAFPGLLAHPEDRSYLTGESGDWLAKLEWPLLGGRFQLLGFGNDNEIATARALRGLGIPQGSPTRNALAWESRSFGARWIRSLGGAALEVRTWSATGNAGATWPGQDSALMRLRADRQDQGMVATVTVPGRAGSTTAGIRLERSSTSYGLEPLSGEDQPVERSVRAPVLAGFVRREQALGARSSLEVSLVSSVAAGAPHLGPGAELKWRPAGGLALSVSYDRRYQFAQSLRNPESVVDNVFPVDIYLGAGPGGVPVARSDVGAIALEFRPTSGTRLGVQGYARTFDGLALVAPGSADPFAGSRFLRGSGTAAGFALEAAATGTWYGLVAGYGFQRVRLQYGDTSYVPEYGAPHSIHAGVIVFPSSGASIRLGMTTALGRRTTAVEGPFEWESCNLADRGCEFAGTPGPRSEPLGSTPLPAYVRLDLGIRKQWPLTLLGRQGAVAAFGTVTNLLARRNILTVAVAPSTGRREPIDMRPRSPLVVGIDWRF
jgi:hypothetical protein